MSDKSSWDTFRKRRFSILKNLLSFYLHLPIIVWYPGSPNSMLCRRCDQCSRRNRTINIVSEKKGWGCVQDARKSNLLPSVSILLLPIVAPEWLFSTLLNSKGLPNLKGKANKLDAKLRKERKSELVNIWLPMDLFDDKAAILNSFVWHSYYGMLRKRIHTNLHPEHPIIAI